MDSSGENRAGRSRPVSSIYEQALGRLERPMFRGLSSAEAA